MKYVSLDLETTGLDPETCEILEIGAILENTDYPLSFDESSKFHCYVLPRNGYYVGQPYALSMNSEILLRVATQVAGYHYFETTEVVNHFKKWLEEQGIDHVTFAGKNFASFDLRFLEKLPGWGMVKVRHRMIDPAILYWEPDDDKLPDTKTCLKRAGLSQEITHTALEDAWQVIELLRRKL